MRALLYSPRAKAAPRRVTIPVTPLSAPNAISWKNAVLSI